MLRNISRKQNAKEMKALTASADARVSSMIASVTRSKRSMMSFYTTSQHHHSNPRKTYLQPLYTVGAGRVYLLDPC